MRLETVELLSALEPFNNGCKFNLRFFSNGDVLIKFGCYLLVSLQTGANEYLQNLISSDPHHKDDSDKQVMLHQEMLVDDIHQVKLELLKIQRSCKHCNQILHEARNQNTPTNQRPGGEKP